MLTPEVRKLVESGELHEFDADWIGNLPQDKQMGAALKITKGTVLEGNGKYLNSISTFRKVGKDTPQRNRPGPNDHLFR